MDEGSTWYEMWRFYFIPRGDATPKKDGTPVTDRDPGDEQIEDIDPERLKVHSWRKARLEKLGLDSHVADLLAASDADLHAMERAVLKGADPRQLLGCFA